MSASPCQVNCESRGGARIADTWQPSFLFRLVCSMPIQRPAAGVNHDFLPGASSNLSCHALARDCFCTLWTVLLGRELPTLQSAHPPPSRYCAWVAARGTLKASQRPLQQPWRLPWVPLIYPRHPRVQNNITSPPICMCHFLHLPSVSASRSVIHSL